MEMKKYNIKGQKDMQKKKKRKWQMIIVKEKSPSVFKCTKNIVELLQFDSILLCLNLALSHQAPYKNLQFLEYWEELFLLLFWRISLTNFCIHWASLSRLWNQHAKKLSFLHFKPRVLNTRELWCWWASITCMDVWSSCKKFGDVRRCTVAMNVEH